MKLHRRIFSYICPLVLSLFLGQNTHAQMYFQSTEYGFAAGASHYFGDLNTERGLKEPKPAFTFLVKRNFNPYISLVGSATYTQLGYKDAYSKNDFYKRRNLDFKSEIYEVALTGEFNFFWFETGNEEKRWTPYILGGISAFYYEPTSVFNNTTYKLRLLGTEGQNTNLYKDRKYNNISVGIPIGFGIKYWIAPGWNLGLSIANRFTFTDYIDDVSQTYVGESTFLPTPGVTTPASYFQDKSTPVDGLKLGQYGMKRGDSQSFDQYMLFQVSLTYHFKTYKCPTTRNTMWDGANVSY